MNERTDKNGLTEEEAIELYRRKNYPKPALTADIAVFAEKEGMLRLLMIRRGGHPYLGCWALPGGFADEGETIEQTAARELEEETGICDLDLVLTGIYSAPGRDPRGWTVSAAFSVMLPDGILKAEAGDDAAETQWIGVQMEDDSAKAILPEGECMAFDHAQIIDEAVHVLLDRGKIRKELLIASPSSEDAAYTFFWNDTEENGVFSNWYRSPFVIDDFEYQHVEQYMMAQKAKQFHDAGTYTAVLKTDEPWKCKELGRKVKPFDSEKWDAVKYEIVKTGNREKYLQNPDLKRALLNTGRTVLAEASPSDMIWGIGLERTEASLAGPDQWPGQNLMGRILMELREEFRN
ncbi:MAG: DUF1768 domain-containing protein [Eubacterium sp.]|nr:DUF1768 domain-containing protein [Eubacterium sp.]